MISDVDHKTGTKEFNGSKTLILPLIKLKINK